MLLIRGGMVHDGISREPRAADILVQDGKISKIGKKLSARGAKVVDAKGLQVYPGFIDAHSHLGLDGFGIGYEGADYNELNDIISPQLRGIDGFKPMQPHLRQAALAGVTTVNTGPGSADVLGGTFTAVKTVGKRADEMVVKMETAMKCAFGENPKRVYRDKGDSSRMTTAAKLREMLFKAKEYAAKKKAAEGDPNKAPGFDMKLEALQPVISGQMPLKAHAHTTEDIFTALRIAREFGVQITLEHVTEGHLIARELAEEGVPLCVGPSLTTASKFELRNRTFETPAILAKAGCKVSITTDAPVIPQEYLTLCAALAVKSGMDPFDALQAITINAALHTGISDKVGSLEVGKDADIVLMDGDCFDVATRAVKVFILGKEVE
ncbi:MAG TPA: amidohydrolase family protein [Clostridia bacterium]|nr:amidohydrolase family protein [Clostridia bacterium]